MTENSSGKESGKIAVIGPTQSGKTCLAVGLYSTNVRGFTVEPVEGSSYLNDRKVEFAGGGWPAPTAVGTKKDIRLDFSTKGKYPIRVSFPDFAGEVLRFDEPESDKKFEAFANEHFSGLSGVVLLVNPGADVFQSGDHQLLADVMSQYKRVLAFLRDENHHSHKAFVALTVTAADRIKGDLRGRLETFNQSVEEISNTLNSSGFTWKRFEVTVTGHLKDQNSPKLAKGRKNSASAPFLWILDELEWRPKRKILLRKIGWAALAVGGFLAIAGAWCGVDAWNSRNDIQKTKNALRNALDECARRANPSPDDLDAVRQPLADLRNWRTKSTWFCEDASKAADDFEQEVWNVHEKRIQYEWSELRKDPSRKGRDGNRVDEVFSSWIPSVADVANKRQALKEKWEKDKPGYQDKYAVAQLLEKISRPLEENQGVHGESAFKLFAGLYGQLAATVPSQPESVALKDEVSAALDDRVATEWRDFAIPDFAKAASTRAADDATRAFVDLLNSWNPATTNGAAAKVELLASVTNSVPGWRRSYETATFLNKVDTALKSGEMEQLAALYPPRATNEFLTAEFVGEQWTNRVEAAFDEARSKFLKSMLDAVVRRQGRPALTDADYAKVDDKVHSVGEPFNADAAKQELAGLVKARDQEWERAKRAECEEWIKGRIRDGRKRTGQNSLWDDYEKAARQNSNPFFVEVAGSAVYKEVEKWFESDVAAFEAALNPDGVSLIWNDNTNFNSRYRAVEARFNEQFKPLCREINKDRNPPAGTWAHRFAELCVNKGRVEDGINKAFPSRIVAKEIRARIDYFKHEPKKNFPVNHKYTSFAAAVEVEAFEADGNTMSELNEREPIIDVVKNHAPEQQSTCITKEKNGEWISIWSGEKLIDTSYFRRTSFVATVTDYNKVTWAKTFTDRFPMAWRTSAPLSWRKEFDFPLKRAGSGADIVGVGVWLLGDGIGETPATLLERAKNETMGAANK